MPYKDPEVRKAFHRCYKKQWRANRGNPLKNFRAYICLGHPNIFIYGAHFSGGFLITDSPEVQAAVEQSPDFFKYIFPIRLDFSGIAREAEEEVDE